MKHEVRVISLVRSPERRASFINDNPHLDFTFFDAIDGTQLSEATTLEPSLFAPGLRYSPGAYGCALSHLTLWQDAVDGDMIITVLEDDAVTRADFAEQSAAVIAGLPDDWDIILWGWNFDTILSLNVMQGVSHAVVIFQQDAMRAAVPEFRAQTQRPTALPLDKCFGTPAYTISPKGARRFMSECFPLSHFQLFFPLLKRELSNTGIDIAMNRIYSTTSSYCTLPPLAITRNERALSTVQG